MMCRCFSIFLTTVLFVSALACLGFGLWLTLQTGGIDDYVLLVEMDHIIMAHWVLVGFSAFLALSGLIGIVAMKSHNSCLVKTYLALIMLACIGTFALGGFIKFYVPMTTAHMDDNAKRLFNAKMDNFVGIGKSTEEDPSKNRTYYVRMNQFEQKHNCCGMDGRHGYYTLPRKMRSNNKTQYLPISCCAMKGPAFVNKDECLYKKISLATDSVKKQTCFPILEKRFKFYFLNWMAIGLFILGGFLLIVFVAGVCVGGKKGDYAQVVV